MTDTPVLLLGAGASSEAGIPVSTEMTAKLAAVINQNPHSHETQALNFVCGALLAHLAAGGASPYQGLDVERVFAAVMLLADRRDLEVTPFVASWHPAVETLDRPRLASFFEDSVGRAVAGVPGATPLGTLIANYVDARIGFGNGDTYRSLATVMIHALRRLLQPADVSYLAPIARASVARGGLTVATLNYDTSIEMAASACGVRAYTCIESWGATREWHWPTDGLRLMKLHGSIDWCWTQDGVGPGRLPVERVVPSDDPVAERRQPALVFGQRSKLTAKGPFLSLLAEFDRLLESTTELLVIGYSFRDDHVNEVIRRWVSSDLSRRITVVDPGLAPSDAHGGVTVKGSIVSRVIPNDGKPDFRRDLLRALNPVTMPGHDSAPQRVEIVSERTSEALGGLLR